MKLNLRLKLIKTAEKIWAQDVVFCPLWGVHFHQTIFSVLNMSSDKGKVQFGIDQIGFGGSSFLKVCVAY